MVTAELKERNAGLNEPVASPVATQETTFDDVATFKVLTLKPRAEYFKRSDRFEDSAIETYDEHLDKGAVYNKNNVLTVNDFGDVITKPSHRFRKRELEKVENGQAVEKQQNLQELLAEKQKANELVKFSLKAKGKAMIACYAIVVLALIIVAIVNAVAIGNLTGVVAGLEGAVVEQMQSNDSLKNELDGASNVPIDKDVFIDASGNTTQIEIPSIAENNSIVVETNWFDNVCDFISGLFGF